MNFDAIWRWLVTVPALVLAGLFGPGGQPAHPGHPSPGGRAPVVRTTPPSRTPGPSNTPRPSGTPGPTATPTPSGGGAALGAVEIASEQTCPGQADVSKTAAALGCLTSNARVFHELKPVSASSALMAAAAAKDQDMKACGYGHTACGRDFAYWIKAKGYGGQCFGENIAMGQKTPREVFVAWMNSAGHRANILNANYRDLGVAELAGPNGPLWAMELGGC
ncbi:MAG TPA: CAP domain-containing protein [Candidatus Saccharimonadia bacterium]